MFTPNEGMLKAMYKAARRQRFRDNMADFGNDLNYNLQRNLRGSNSNEDLIKGALSAGATAAFGPVGGLAAGFLGNALFPQEQETVVNPRVERNLNPYGMAQGGMVQQNMVPVEVEGDEMFELPNGQVGEFDGPNHEQGGIPTALPAGTNVYSKRVRGEDGRTMADRKESREKRLKKILEQLKKRPADAPTRNAVSREVERIEQEEQQDMQIMQMYQLRDMLAQARQEQMMQGQMQGQMQGSDATGSDATGSDVSRNDATSHAAATNAARSDAGSNAARDDAGRDADDGSRRCFISRVRRRHGIS